jgi:uncharacterized membrane protein YeaQ/YmgE (transglycosylase-associated protein family)
MDIVGLLVNAVAGVIGGTATGKAMKNSSGIGMTGSTIAGLLGGLGGGALTDHLSMFANAAQAGGFDVTALVGQVVGGGVGGAILTAIVGMLLKKKTAA